MTNLAIFDLDYTLTKRGTWGRFVFQNVKWQPWLWAPLLISAGWHQWCYKQGKLERINVKESMMRWSMVGKSHEDMLKIAREFAKNEVPHKLRPGAIRAVEKHKQAGDVLIIASAAVDVVVEAICEELEIQYWTATEMHWEHGKLLSKFKSKNCYGDQKLANVVKLLDENAELKQIDTVITFYSDSHSDVDMFQFCDIGVAVNPTAKLRAMAPELGIDVIDWNI